MGRKCTNKWRHKVKVKQERYGINDWILRCRSTNRGLLKVVLQVEMEREVLEERGHTQLRGGRSWRGSKRRVGEVGRQAELGVL